MFFCSFERTDIIQISNISLYYNRFSILTNDSLKSMGLFRIQLLLEDNTGVLDIIYLKTVNIQFHQLMGQY